RILLPRQCLELFRPFDGMPVEIIVRNLPLFMLKKLPELMRNPRDKQWVLHLARGKNIRTADRLPFPMTNKMAHCFINLSDAADTREAFWLAFGQSCGADDRVVNGFRRFWRLPEIREHYSFLQSAMTFAQQAGYDGRQLNAVVGYWRHTCHESQGKYSLAGRTPESVIRQAEAFYQATQNGLSYQKMTFWRAHPTVKPFLLQTEAGVFTIVELTSSYELQEEGKAMRHCVGIYAWQCRQGSCSIWSLRFSDGLSKETLVTIELSAAGRIVQARGLQNRLPSDSEMTVIRQWTAEQGIRV
ncbi:MAG: PcfJ domain-containing protein, partial [Thermoanaerobaculia bacterium]|nr:PcfJ domain-containing protein [Thermoanaerobaculia bacterium]